MIQDQQIDSFNDDTSPMSEAGALKRILLWSGDRPTWQRDALRRLLTNGELFDEDIADLYSICIGDKKEYSPLSEEHLSSEAVPEQPIRLTKISHPVGINALAENQLLEFNEKGLTLIYGDNGTGKSGYVRILKHACRSRDTKVKILPKVGERTSEAQSAKIFFKRGSEDNLMEWSPNIEGHADLPSVSIFDSRSASTHVEATNNVAYTPFPMKVLKELANACDVISGDIKDKVIELEQQTPQAIASPKTSPNTAAGAYLANLSDKSNKDNLRLLCTLADQEEARYKALSADLSQDRKQAIARLSSMRSRLLEAKTLLEALSKASSDDAAKHHNELKRKKEDTAKLADTASETLFEASPLPEIGGELWRSLWEAARRYSDEVAYPQSKFPKAEANEDLCVLCQQPLGEEAVLRRQTFEEFIKGTTKEDEASAKAAYESAISKLEAALPEINVGKSAHRLIRAELGDRPLARKMRITALNAIRRIHLMLSGDTPPSPFVKPPVEELQTKIDEVTNRITSISARDDSDERKQLVAEHQALEDRIRLREIQADIEAEIDRKVQIAALKKAGKTAAKVSVTNKNKELANKLVTDALRSRFAREVQKLKIGTLPIELKKEKDSNAESFFRVALVAQPTEPLGEILSEGEHRCVALAAFLAELVTSREYSGIVFDDPMSSLDHLYRRNVAVRLSEEAQHRQVIVFTHDISFLFELMREAHALSVPTHFQSFSRKQDQPGFIEDDLPLKAKHAAPMANALESELKQIKGEFDDWNDTRRTLFCKGFIEQLREAWDQGIADFIFPVLGRFDSQIRGTSIYKLEILAHSDVARVTAARGRLSNDLHANPQALNPESVTHDQLSVEIKDLRDWLANIRERQARATKPNISYASLM